MSHTTSSTTSSPCVCCAPCVTGTLLCRSKGGTAELIGFSELADPSTPPKKYLTLTIGYDFIGCVYSGTNVTCSPESPLFVAVYHVLSASGGYNPVTGAYTPPGAESCAAIVSTCADHSTSCSPLVFPEGDPPPSWSTPNTTQTVSTSTQQVWRAIEECHPGIESLPTTGSGGFANTLSEEDTEENAITRLLAGTSFDSYGVGPCVAGWEERTAGFTFAYQLVEFKVTQSGLLPSTLYSVNVDIFRRAYGVDPYVLFSTLTVAGTTDGSGNLSIDDVEIPGIERGFQYFAAIGACPP